MIKVTKSKAKSVAQLTKDMDAIFAVFIKVRDSDATGFANCFVTGVRLPYRMMEAAHYYPRQHMGTRWDEMNVHACTVESNRYDRDHQKQYDAAMLKRYSLDELADLGARKMSLMKFTAGEIADLIEVYKEKVKVLRKEKGL